MSTSERSTLSAMRRTATPTPRCSRRNHRRRRNRLGPRSPRPEPSRRTASARQRAHRESSRMKRPWFTHRTNAAANGGSKRNWTNVPVEPLSSVEGGRRHDDSSDSPRSTLPKDTGRSGPSGGLGIPFRSGRCEPGILGRSRTSPFHDQRGMRRPSGTSSAVSGTRPWWSAWSTRSSRAACAQRARRPARCRPSPVEARDGAAVHLVVFAVAAVHPHHLRLAAVPPE